MVTRTFIVLFLLCFGHGVALAQDDDGLQCDEALRARLRERRRGDDLVEPFMVHVRPVVSERILIRGRDLPRLQPIESEPDVPPEIRIRARGDDEHQDDRQRGRPDVPAEGGTSNARVLEIGHAGL